MNGDDDLEFECESCGTMFQGTLYGIDRELEKVIFASENVPEVDILDSENIANFCSIECRDRGRDAVMRAQQVPIRRVGLGPIEPCAKCNSPVDMSDWHLTFLDSDTHFSALGVQPLNVDYLAVLCKSCYKESSAAASETDARDLSSIEKSNLTDGPAQSLVKWAS